ncbi:MAG: ABC transporter ATP-binding protein [Ruminococcus sp.]|nr:ABC transporter ATP-binding protein [Ruminococcus sp.]
MSVQLKCEKAVLGYDNNVVSEQIDFSVSRGDYLCVLGENGAGKSTLMKTLLGLTPLMGGSITFCGDMAQNEIGYLPQQTQVQRDFPASVREIVQSGCLNRCGLRPFYNREEKEMARSAMEKLGITDLAKSCYRELSGGQQQRVLLARALCATRKMLLLDEPVTGLDPKAAREMYELTAKLNREEQVTILMISHDINAITYATHILQIGKTQQFFGTKDEYLKSRIGQAFLCNFGEEGSSDVGTL